MAKVSHLSHRESAARLAAPFLERLPISGLAISIFDHTGGPVTVFASDRVATRIEEIQFDLGEGPLYSTYRTGKPIVVPDLRIVRRDRWPLFSYGVAAVDARAIYNFPLSVGEACVGVAATHSFTAGTLSPEELEAGVLLAKSIAMSALTLAISTAREDFPVVVPGEPRSRREIYQATGMVISQLGTTATDAFARIQAHAFLTSHTVSDVASEITHRRLDLRVLAD